MLKDHPYQKDEKDQEKDGLHNQEAEAPDPVLELRLWRATSQAFGNIPEGCVATRRNDERGRGAAHHRGAEEDHIGCFSTSVVSGTATAHHRGAEEDHIGCFSRVFSSDLKLIG